MNPNLKIPRLRLLPVVLFFIFTTSAECFAEGHKKRHSVPPAFWEIIDISMEKKVGVTFFLNAQTLPAVVTKKIDDTTIEGQSQQYGRIIIRLHRVDAVALQ